MSAFAGETYGDKAVSMVRYALDHYGMRTRLQHVPGGDPVVVADNLKIGGETVRIVITVEVTTA